MCYGHVIESVVKCSLFADIPIRFHTINLTKFIEIYNVPKSTQSWFKSTKAHGVNYGTLVQTCINEIKQNKSEHKHMSTRDYYCFK